MSQENSYYQEARSWLDRNKLKTVGVGWAAVLGSCLAYQWTRPIPLQMKIIHSRVYAQGVTLAALAGSALVAYVEREPETPEPIKE